MNVAYAENVKLETPSIQYFIYLHELGIYRKYDAKIQIWGYMARVMMQPRVHLSVICDTMGGEKQLYHCACSGNNDAIIEFLIVLYTELLSLNRLHWNDLQIMTHRVGFPCKIVRCQHPLSYESLNYESLWSAIVTGPICDTKVLNYHGVQDSAAHGYIWIT